MSEASDMSKSTESYESEEVSDESVGSSWRYKSRSRAPRSLARRKGRKGKFSKYRDDFGKSHTYNYFVHVNVQMYMLND